MNQIFSIRTVAALVGTIACLGLVSFGITRETPMGSIRGLATMKENGRPLPGALVELRPVRVEPGVGTKWLPTDEARRTLRFETKEDGTFAWRNIQAGDYELSINSNAHSHNASFLHISEGKTLRQDVELTPTEPYLNFYTSQHVFTPDENVELSLTGFGKGETLKIDVYRLRQEHVLSYSSLYNALAPLSRISTGNDAGDPANMGQLVQSLEPKIVTRDVEGVFNERIQLKPMEEDLYWVQSSFGEHRRGTWISVSKLALVTKQVAGETTVFATDIRSGEPIPGAQIGYAQNGSFLPMAVSDSNGLATFRVDPEKVSSGVIMAVKGQSKSFVDMRATKPQGDQLKTFVYTDRPVYRPGDQIHFKGLVRSLQGDQYSVPSGAPIEIEVRDADDNLLQRTNATLSDMGSFAGSVAVHRESKPGSYSIQTKLGGQSGYATFEVSEYRKPEFSISVEPQAAYYVRGDVVSFEVKCEYFFGGPVQNAEVEAYIMRAPQWDYSPMDEEFDDYEYGEYGDYGGEYVTTVNAKTDSSGRAILSVPSVLSPEDFKEIGTNDFVFTAEVSVTEGSGKYFDGKGSVRVVRSSIAAKVELDRYVVKPGQPFDATVTTFDPIEEKPHGEKEVTVEAGYLVWEGDSERFVPFARQYVKTNAQGRVVMAITPERGGQLEIRARTRDSQGRESEGTAYTFVDKRGDWYGGSWGGGSELSVRLDRKQYEPGETAKLVIQTDKPGATALVCIEADKLYSTQTIKLREPITIVELKVIEQHSPTAFVTVGFVQDKEFQTRQRRLAVEVQSKKLDVTITSDKGDYLPGELASYTLVARDNTGRPARAEFSFGVVDESIYRILEDRTDIVSEFYPKRYNSVETRYSFEEIYLDGGDKAPKNIEIRKRFKDTAFWSPIVRTDGQGRAQIEVQLPDNLTTWRATAIGIDADTRVGQSTTKVRASRPLMARLEAPTFFVQGDKQRVQCFVTNDSGRDAEVKVEMTEPSGGLKGELRRSARAKNGETVRFEWEFEAIRTGEAVMIGKAWIDDQTTDGVELRVPVYPHGRTYQETRAGVAQGAGEFEFTVRNGADAATGRLRLLVAPSLASSLAESLDELVGFPYGCVEQTLSRFVPTVLVSQAVASSGMPPPTQAAQMPQMVAEGVSRLRTLQQSNGSWGWWGYDEGDEFMTGYVLEGLARAKAAGFNSDESMIRRAVEWGKGRLKSSIVDMMEAERRKNGGRRADYYEYVARQLTEGRVQLVYGLALHAPDDSVLMAARLLQPGKESTYAIGTMSLLFGKLGDDAGRDRWLARMLDLAIESDGLVSWNQGYGVESTARGLEAMMAANPQHPFAPRVVRYLMRQRRGGMWWSTRDTSAALAGLTRYFALTKELVSSAPIEVYLDGNKIQTISIDTGRLEQPDQWIEVPFAELKEGNHSVRIVRNGAVAYYTADVRQTVVQSDVGALDGFPGVMIRREYFPLSQSRLENGSLTVLPTEKSVSSIQEGGLVKVVLTLKTERALQYLIVEDPIPSHCRIQDRGEVDSIDDWSWWWAETVVRDDKAAFFITNLEPGEHRLTYVMRAENPGSASALPTLVYNMYDPDRRAGTPSDRFEVTRK